MGNKIFQPQEGWMKFVDASSPHPPNTRYRVAIGHELWPDKAPRVLKIQMEYDGVISGRRSPSFPIGTDDAERVLQAMRALLEEAGREDDASTDKVG